MRWILVFVFLLVLGGAGAGAAYFLLKPSATKFHPQYGTDCADLLDASTQNAVDCVRVLFGTNRELVLEGEEPAATHETDVRRAASGDAQLLQFGRADVWLPKLVEEGGSRDRGETPILEGPAPEDPSELAKYVFLTRITKSGRESFLTGMDAALATRGSDSVLLFVHGFNTPFEDALIRSAQLSVDLTRRGVFDVGVPVLFSWPSAGKVSLDHYRGDQDRSLAAAPYLEEFLDTITSREGVARINIVAHSMGNRILTEALKSYASDYLERHGRDDLEFRIILVAADVDRDIFDAAAGILDNLKANVTIYTSDADRALHVSEIVNSKARLGDTNGDKPFIRQNAAYQTVDATGIATELFGLGHNYYSDNPFVLGDIVCALAQADPEVRALERRRYAGLPDGLEYFSVNVAVAPANADCTLYRTAFPLTEVRDAVGAPLSVPETREGAPPEPDTRMRMPPPESEPQPLPAPPPPPPPPAAEPMAPPAPMPSAIPPAFINVWVEDRATFIREAPYREELQPFLTLGQIERVVIHAHTDSVGSAENNLEISRRWADAVRNWMIAMGVEPALIEAEGFGEDRPSTIVPDETPEPLNQRIEVVFYYAR